jgi:hypothetical protein
MTAARSLSDTFAAIAPGNVPGFVLAQLVVALAALAAIKLLLPDDQRVGAKHA